MGKKAVCIAFATVSLTFSAIGQTTYLQLGTEDYHVLDRLETKSGSLSNQLFLNVKPTPRKGLVHFLEDIKAGNSTDLTEIDQYNIEHAISVSGEWAADEDGQIDSKKPLLKTFYKKQPDFVYAKTDNFFLSANPVFTAGGVYEKGNSNNPLFTSNRGAEIRGWIAKRIGFYTFITDNQEELPSYVASWADSSQAVPGADYYTRKGPAKYDYMLARGYIDFAAVKDHINITFGYDKHFFGNGMRSTFMSDFGPPATFLRLNTKIWKLNYQNLYMELTPQFTKGVDRKLPHKYATMHYLSVNVTKWLNLGLFEAVIFNRRDRYDFSYMVPIILYRQVERSLGSPDNVLLGLDGKILIAKKVQLYGQLMLDEFTAKELIGGNGYWANKFAIQAGAKYFDAGGVKNLDLQGEINIVRPFTYAHFDSTGNYTHYNQPLAHPLGAGFGEVLGQIRYQPVKNLFLSVKGMYYVRSGDTTGTNFGSNIFKGYYTRTPVQDALGQYGYGLVNGIRSKCASLNLNASYELKENLFIDLGGVYRRFAFPDGKTATTSDTYVYAGIRLNFSRRDYNFF